MVLAFAPIAGHHIITWIVIGLIAGLVAAKVVDHGGMGFVRDTVIGLIGAVIGGLLLHEMTGTHASPSILVEIVVAFIGAVILLLVLKAMSHGGARRRV